MPMTIQQCICIPLCVLYSCKVLFLHCFFLQIKSNTPILLCSVSGYDASGRVDDLAAQLGKQCTPIAIGESWENPLNSLC